MIDKGIVEGLVAEWLEGKDYFLVDVTVTPDDRIVVEIDHAEGVWIEDCVDLSRFIESRLSRDEEDYELEVGSAGLGQPFKVVRQYVNHVGREVEVLTCDGRKAPRRAGIGRRRGVHPRGEGEAQGRRREALPLGGRDAGFPL